MYDPTRNLHQRTFYYLEKSAYMYISLFDPTNSWEIYTAESGGSLVFQPFVLACHSLIDTQTC
jgi:hypothetical protein